MTSQTYNGTSGTGYMARIAELAPSARTAKALQTLRSKRHTIDDARKAVAAKLRSNAAYLRGASSEKPDLVYKQQGDGTYAVGIKYGNRWLSGVFEGGNFITNLDQVQACTLLDGFAEDAVAGAFDAYIEPIRQANVVAGNARKQ